MKHQQECGKNQQVGVSSADELRLRKRPKHEKRAEKLEWKNRAEMSRRRGNRCVNEGMQV